MNNDDIKVDEVKEDVLESSDDRELIYNTLSQTAYWMVNKRLSESIGNDTAILLADLISKERYHRQKEDMIDDWFFCLQERIEQDTGLSPYKQRVCIQTLVDYNFLQTKRMGLPPKLYFKINPSQILKILRSIPKKIKELYIYNKNKDIKNKNISLERKDILRDTKSVPSNCTPKFKRTSHKNNSIQKTLHHKLLQSKSNKPTLHPVRKLHPLVEYWNSLPHTPKHTDPNSKTHKCIIQKVNALKAGKFDQYSFHPDWLKNNPKVTTLLTKRWSNVELQKLVLMLSHLMDSAYKGAFKKKVALSELLYSIYHNNSIALAVWLRPPVLISEAVSEAKINPKHIDLINRLVPWFQEGKETKPVITNKFKAEVSSYISKLEQVHQAIKGKFRAQSWYSPDSLMLATSYISWLEDHDVHPDHRMPRVLDVNSWLFKEYADVYLEGSNVHDANKSLGSILTELKIWK